MKDYFSQRLKSLRIENGFSQREMAQQLNVAQVSYLRWEQGKTEPNINNICAICEIFNVTADYLLGNGDEFDTKPYEPKILQYSLDEQRLISVYRTFPAEKKQALLKLLEI